MRCHDAAALTPVATLCAIATLLFQFAISPFAAFRLPITRFAPPRCAAVMLVDTLCHTRRRRAMFRYDARCYADSAYALRHC